MSNMVVRTNIMSLNAHRNMGMTGTQQARASARLSSGFRINSAADDAAGLAISEKMRGQIRGLDQASRNAQDGISLIQTAEGAMQTINDMVIRIRELVVQSANDTNVHQPGREELSDRVQIQREIDQLLDEIDAVTVRTEFNTRVLLDGSLASDPLRGISATVINTWMGTTGQALLTAMETAQTNLNNGQIRFDTFVNNRQVLEAFYNRTNAITLSTIAADITQYVNAMDDILDPNLAAATVVTRIATFLGVTDTDLVNTGDAMLVDAFVASARAGTLSDADFAMGTDVVNAARDSFVMNNVDALTLGFTTAVVATPSSITLPAHGLTADSDLAALRALISGSGHYSATAYGNNVTALNTLRTHLVTHTNAANVAVSSHAAIGQRFSTMAELANAIERQAAGLAGNALWFQIGANEGQGISVNIEAVDSTSLGINHFRSGGIHSVEAEFGENLGSTGLITILDEALAVVTGQRAILGAVQNRLEFTIENLDTASENLQAANSRIRDADMAREMMRLTQMNVLQQAAISMLAQANQAPQNILQLLR